VGQLTPSPTQQSINSSQTTSTTTKKSGNNKRRRRKRKKKRSQQQQQGNQSDEEEGLDVKNQIDKKKNKDPMKELERGIENLQNQFQNSPSN